MSKFGGEGSNPPYEAIRLTVCERMGWTFEEYDNTPARDLYVAFELWRHMDNARNNP